MQGKKRPSAQDAVPPGHVHCFIPGYAVGRSVVLSLVATKGGERARPFCEVIRLKSRNRMVAQATRTSRLTQLR